MANKTKYNLINGDCISEMKKMKDNSIDSIVTDPPYELGFMGKKWDSTGIAFDINVWKEAYRVLKPGGHMLAFSGTRTYHRMVCAIEDAGFEIRDQLAWIYGSGFPKSKNMGVMVDKKNGVKARGRAIPAASTHFPNGKYAEGKTKLTGNEWAGVEYKPETDEAKKWNGWGTGLKPAQEPIVLARKPLSESTVAKNVVKHGTGAINIDDTRVATTDKFGGGAKGSSGFAQGYTNEGWVEGNEKGRWPANVIHDGSDEVLGLFPDSKGGAFPNKRGKSVNTTFASGQETVGGARQMNDDGSAARFFYCAKANKQDREKDNNHPTVKPTQLMRYLVRLITPPNGVVLDPFNGSGSTGKAAMLENKNYIGIDLSADYIKISEARIKKALSDYENEHIKDEFFTP